MILIIIYNVDTRTLLFRRPANCTVFDGAVTYFDTCTVCTVDLQYKSQNVLVLVPSFFWGGGGDSDLIV